MELSIVEHAEVLTSDASASSKIDDSPTRDTISFSKVDIITPGQKLLARKLTYEVAQGKSLLVTGKYNFLV